MAWCKEALPTRNAPEMSSHACSACACWSKEHEESLLMMGKHLMQLAFVTTTSDSYRQIKLWTDYHKSIGVGSFYLFVDGQVCPVPLIERSTPSDCNACRTLWWCLSTCRGIEVTSIRGVRCANKGGRCDTDLGASRVPAQP